MWRSLGSFGYAYYMSKSLEKIARVALPIIGAAVAGPLGAAAGGAIAGGVGGNAPNGGGIKGALIGAATGYAGNAIGSSLGSSLSTGIGGSTIGGSLSAANAVGPYSFGDFGSSIANTLGNTVANTTLGSAVGNYAGNSIAGNLSDSLFPQNSDAKAPAAPTGDSPFAPARQAQLTLPGSLSGFSDLSQDQQSSNIATQGVYGGGNGPEEQAYFQNLINRRLVDDSGNVDQNVNDVSPIEKSYLSELGLGGSGTSSSILEALSKWKNPSQMSA